MSVRARAVAAAERASAVAAHSERYHAPVLPKEGARSTTGKGGMSAEMPIPSGMKPHRKRSGNFLCLACQHKPLPPRIPFSALSDGGDGCRRTPLSDAYSDPFGR